MIQQYKIQFNNVSGGSRASFDDSSVKIFRLTEFGGQKEASLLSLIPQEVEIIRRALQQSVLANPSGTKLSKPEMAAALSSFDRQLQSSKPQQNKEAGLLR
ncbi:MAG: hypothetical protein ABID61_05645 [Candidatus Micrarchaeota archaeon]